MTVDAADAPGTPGQTETRTAVAAPADLSLDDPDFLTGDRREVYRRLRDDYPAVPIGPDGHQTWIVSRYADVQSVFRDPHGRMQPVGIDAPPWMPEGPTRRRLRANMVQIDRPVHTRLRGIVGPLFTVRQSELMRQTAADTVAGELDTVVSQAGRFDAVSDLAAQVPKGVLRLLIGMPDEDWALMTEKQIDFLAIFSPFPLDPAAMAHLDEVSQFYFAYFDDLLGRIRQPTELVARLLTAEQAGELTHDEVLSVMHTVLDAGFETTRTSISNAVELFATSPATFELVRRDESLVGGLVEEVLRVRAPVQANTRIIPDDYECSDGTVIPGNSHVLALIGAANTDERFFPQPDQVDPTRSNAARHLTFGGGLHHCLGAPLARLQLQETLRGLAARVESITLDAQPGARHPSLIFPSLSSLPVHAHIK